MTIEDSFASRRGGRWLVKAALVLGGVLFVARYLVLGLLYVKSLVANGSISSLDILGVWYFFLLGHAFSYPLVFWSVFVASLALVAVALFGGRPRKVARVALALVGLAILITPVIHRYRPAVRAESDTVMRVPTMPNVLWSAPKAFAAGAEIRRCVYELHGWNVEGALYYMETCGARVSQWRYALQTDSRQQVIAVPGDVLRELAPRPTDSVNATMPGDDALQISTRGPVLVSPDGVWRAFIARHLYGPEDVVVVSAARQDL